MADKIPEQVEAYIKENSAALNQMGFGGVMGLCSGMAFKRVGKAVGVVIGLGFMGVQAAASEGYIDVDWMKVKESAIKPFDTNTDGKIDEKDVQVLWNKYKSTMTDQVPGAGGFAAGFLLGLRK
eukprot:Nitzschia sp. Nitz4//scaffold3_size479765//209991//210438//NITZ4_000088-RA/size479765-augustus-gene-1.565-mRNA-1//1//CDS//3329550722//7007//frame0